jgi:hypothetical protein
MTSIDHRDLPYKNCRLKVDTTVFPEWRDPPVLGGMQLRNYVVAMVINADFVRHGLLAHMFCLLWICALVLVVTEFKGMVQCLVIYRIASLNEDLALRVPIELVSLVQDRGG